MNIAAPLANPAPQSFAAAAPARDDLHTSATRDGGASPAIPILSNPAMRLDSKLNMVVIEFYDADGDVRAKIPSERELRAYQQGNEPAAGPNALSLIDQI